MGDPIICLFPNSLILKVTIQVIRLGRDPLSAHARIAHKLNGCCHKQQGPDATEDEDGKLGIRYNSLRRLLNGKSTMEVGRISSAAAHL